MVDVFDNLNRFVFGPIGFIVSLGTLYLSTKIKAAVSSALTRKNLRMNLESYKQTIDDAQKMLSLDSDVQLENGIIKIQKLLGELEHKLPDSKSSIISKFDNALNESKHHVNYSNKMQRMTLIRLLSHLKSIIEAEADQ